LAPLEERELRRIDEVGIGKRELEVAALAIKPAMLRLDLRAVLELPERPRGLHDRIVALGLGLALVPGDQLLHRGLARCVLDGHDAMGPAVESREMVEGERQAINLEPLRDTSLHAARREIPGGDVQ